jgi:hypothetical protein
MAAASQRRARQESGAILKENADSGNTSTPQVFRRGVMSRVMDSEWPLSDIRVAAALVPPCTTGRGTAFESLFLSSENQPFSGLKSTPRMRGTSFHVREKQIPACGNKRRCKNARMTQYVNTQAFVTIPCRITTVPQHYCVSAPDDGTGLPAFFSSAVFTSMWYFSKTVFRAMSS